MKNPIIVIVGETASGKSEMAMELASSFSGEIISGDSRAVYRKIDIGSAKPTKEDQARIRHHLIDVVEPDEQFTAADFKREVDVALSDIYTRGKIPFLVGGSGLYIDSVLYDFEFRPLGDPSERAKLEKLSVEELQSMISKRGLSLPYNSKNPRHLIRTLETNGVIGSRYDLREDVVIIGVARDDDELRIRLGQRLDKMIRNGLIEEIEFITKKYDWDLKSMQIPIYKAFRQYIENQITLAQAKELSIQNEMNLARKQRTWFKRNKAIHWVTQQGQAVDLITTKLNK